MIALQHLPVQYLHVVANEYFPGKHSPIEIRDSLLDLLGDVFFVVPALVTAQYHRGESPKSTLQGHCPVRPVSVGICVAH